MMLCNLPARIRAQAMRISLTLAFLAAPAAAVDRAAAAGQSAEVPPMRFVIVRGSSPSCEPACAEWISAEGEIVGDTASRFKKFLKKLGDRKLPIIIRSPGGDVDNALALGRLIRAKGLDVGVGQTGFTSCAPEAKGCKAEHEGGYTGYALSTGALCNSACPMALAGGVNRVVGTMGGRIGVHQITTVSVKQNILYRTTTRVVNGKKVTSKEIVRRERAKRVTTTAMSKDLRRKLRRYFEEMGVSADILQPIEETPAAGIRFLTHQELRSLNLVTGTDSVESWTSTKRCDRLPLAANCRQVADPPRIRIVRNREVYCPPNCAEWISLEGDIDQTALPQLEAALERLGGPRPLVLASRGGDLESAVALGRFVRERQLDVIIGRTISQGCQNGRSEPRLCEGEQAYLFEVGQVDIAGARPLCTSVCPFALAGGIQRIVDDRLSIHLDSLASLPRAPAAGKKKQPREPAETLLAGYLEEMGVSAHLLLAAPKTPGASAFLSARALLQMKLATQN